MACSLPNYKRKDHCNTTRKYIIPHVLTAYQIIHKNADLIWLSQEKKEGKEGRRERKGSRKGEREMRRRKKEEKGDEIEMRRALFAGGGERQQAGVASGRFLNAYTFFVSLFLFPFLCLPHPLSLPICSVHSISTSLLPFLSLLRSPSKTSIN